MALNEVLMEIRVGIRRAIRRNQELRTIKIRCMERCKLDLDRPGTQLALRRHRRSRRGRR